jgi:hypothetical protein
VDFKRFFFSVQKCGNSWGSYSQGKKQRLAIIYSVGWEERKMESKKMLQIGEKKIWPKE